MLALKFFERNTDIRTVIIKLKMQNADKNLDLKAVLQNIWMGGEMEFYVLLRSYNVIPYECQRVLYNLC